jgi:hypothetical protein
MVHVFLSGLCVLRLCMVGQGKVVHRISSWQFKHVQLNVELLHSPWLVVYRVLLTLTLLPECG